MSPKSSTNPERDNFLQAFAQVLGHGHTLEADSLTELGGHYGYESRVSSATAVKCKYGRTMIAGFGVELEIENYRGLSLYKDATIEPEKTDIMQTRAYLDRKADERTLASIRGKERKRQNTQRASVDL